MSVVFDKLSFVSRLEGEGKFTRPQAKTLSDAFHEAILESVATKDDVAETRRAQDLMRVELTGEVATLRTELKADMAALRTDVKADVAALRTDLKVQTAGLRASIADSRVWMVSVGASIIAVLSAIKYFG